MKWVILASLIAGGGLVAYGALSDDAPRIATCTGKKDCKACKSCRYCKHCAKEGGSCGVKGGGK